MKVSKQTKFSEAQLHEGKAREQSGQVKGISNATSNASSGSATLFAILGGACCWGPLFFSVIGIGASTGGILGSAASFLGAIAPYRNYFLILNIIGVLLSFYFIYIMPNMLLKKSAVNAGVGSNGETCDCETKSSSLNLSKIIFFLSLMITVGMFAYLYMDTGQIFTAWPAV